MPFDGSATDLSILSNAEIHALALSRPGRDVLLRLEMIMLMRIIEAERLAAERAEDAAAVSAALAAEPVVVVEVVPEPQTGPTAPKGRNLVRRRAKGDAVMVALRQATAACEAECRPSREAYRRVHIGDWFARTLMVDTAKLGLGMSPRVAKTGKVSYSRTIHQMRVPAPEYWPAGMRDMIREAVIAG